MHDRSSCFRRSRLNEIEYQIAEILENAGMQYFKITAFEKIENYKADILFQISPTEPIYVNQINISGNDFFA